MDLTQPLSYNVLVEREGFAFFADIEYENLLDFCSHCRKSGYSTHNCKLHNKVKLTKMFVQKSQIDMKNGEVEVNTNNNVQE